MEWSASVMHSIECPAVSIAVLVCLYVCLLARLLTVIIRWPRNFVERLDIYHLLFTKLILVHFLFWNVFRDPSVSVQAFDVYVRPLLEYSSLVWSPHHKWHFSVILYYIQRERERERERVCHSTDMFVPAVHHVVDSRQMSTWPARKLLNITLATLQQMQLRPVAHCSSPTLTSVRRQRQQGLWTCLESQQ